MATIYVFYKDIKFIWKNILIFLVHMIAIFIPIERYPAYLEKYTRMNPLFIYSNVARLCILERRFDSNEIELMMIWTVGVFLFGMIIFKIKENDIIKKI